MVDVCCLQEGRWGGHCYIILGMDGYLCCGDLAKELM